MASYTSLENRKQILHLLQPYNARSIEVKSLQEIEARVNKIVENSLSSANERTRPTTHDDAFKPEVQYNLSTSDSKLTDIFKMSEQALFGVCRF